MSETFQVPNLVRGLKIIEFLVTQESPQTITEIANAMELPKNSVMRIIHALEHYDYVNREAESKRYRITRKLFSMAYRMPHEKTLIESSRDAMRIIRDEFKETVVLTVIEGARGIILEQVQGLHPFRFVCEPGVQQSLHSSASTKAILAFMPEQAQQAMLERIDYTPYTENTLSSRSALSKELVQIRRQGYALDRAEQIEGVHCVAAAIQDHTGAPVAALTTTGPSSRIDLQQDAAHIGNFIRTQTLAVSRELGYVPENRLTALPA
ncbi:MAG: IclR family transcriptional regulator [Coraliomargarita sp.]